MKKTFQSVAQKLTSRKFICAVIGIINHRLRIGFGATDSVISRSLSIRNGLRSAFFCAADNFVLVIQDVLCVIQLHRNGITHFIK